MAKDIQIPRVSFIYDRRKVSARGKLASVEIEVYHNRKRLWFSTGVMLNPSQWKLDTVVCHDKKDELNGLLQGQYEYIQSCIMDMYSEGCFQLDKLKGLSFVSDATEDAICTSELIVEDIQNIPNLYDWMESRRKERLSLTAGTMRQHALMIRMVKSSGLFSDFGDITSDNINKWDKYLHDRTNPMGETLKQSTVHKFHKHFKMYVKEAYLLGFIQKNPYSSMRIARGSSDTVKYLDDAERTSIENLKLSGMIDNVRNMFLFACYTGLSYSDMIKIKKSDVVNENGRYYIDDRRNKTKSHYKITLLPKALAILEKYDYNLKLISNQKSNKNLKKIAKLAGINKNLTMHMGRHTFATCALQHGVPIEIVSKMLAHSDIKTTQIYAQVLQENVDYCYDVLKNM